MSQRELYAPTSIVEWNTKYNINVLVHQFSCESLRLIFEQVGASILHWNQYHFWAVIVSNSS